jgi:hypothetical protein
VKARQRVASFDLAGSHELRDFKGANAPRLLVAIDVADGRIGGAQVDADDIPAGQLFGKKVVGSG